MIQFFNLRVDPISFWLGFALGGVFIFLILQIRGQSKNIYAAAQRQFQAARQSLSAGTKSRLLADMYHYAQHQHLAAGLFPLRQITVTPRVMAFPVSPSAAVEFVQDEITNRVLPYMPDWPEAAAVFHAPSLTLAEALEGGSHLLLIGQPGSGKSTALAHLVSQFAVSDPAVEKIGRRFPVLVHAAELLSALTPANKDPLAPLADAVSAMYASPLVQSRLGSVLKAVFGEGQALLLIDGLDEFEPGTAQKIPAYVESLLKTYPLIQVAAAASLDNYLGLNQLGLVPTAIAGWSDEERTQFAGLWREAWMSIQKDVDPNDLAQKASSELIGMWLDFADASATPFEQTLKTWASFAGDIPSAELPRLIETHLRRLAPSLATTRGFLEQLALQMVQNQKILFGWKETDTILRKGSAAPAGAAEAGTAPADPAEKKGREAKNKPAGMPPVLEDLVAAGILTLQSKDQIRFSHPLITSYLAGRALSQDSSPARLAHHADWWGKNLSMGFQSCFMDVSPMVTTLMNEGSSLPTQNTLFQIARWLRLSSKNQGWRAVILRSLANIAYKEPGSNGLSCRAVTALAVSGDATVIGLFRQMRKSEQAEIRQLAALGMGLALDPKTYPDLAALTQDPKLGVCQAACLALVRLGTKQAVDAVIGVLLHGTEEMRRAAAESLSAHPAEGLAILKEALTMDDLLVRRAALFGLTRIREPEVTKLLEETAVSDGQWVVRNLAVQMLEQRRLPNPYIYTPLPPVTDLGWLLAFAARSGVGVVNEKEAVEMIINAVERGETKEKLEALHFLAQRGNQIAVRAVYNAYYGGTNSLKNAAFNTIWHLQASGIEMPSPMQFGLS